MSKKKNIKNITFGYLVENDINDFINQLNAAKKLGATSFNVINHGFKNITISTFTNMTDREALIDEKDQLHSRISTIDEKLKKL